MNKVQIIANTLFAILCAVLVNTKSFAEPINLAHYKSELRAYHDTQAYDKELATVAQAARRYINQRAIANQQSAHPKKLAIVLDIDETSLSDYANMNARDFALDLDKVHQGYTKADSPAIQAILELYNDALAHQVNVFFVTGRSEALREPTEKNLIAAGYKEWTGIYFKPAGTKFASDYKTKTRAAITKLGYHIIASIGDQDSDLIGGYADKTFKLPNPYYEIL